MEKNIEAYAKHLKPYKPKEGIANNVWYLRF